MTRREAVKTATVEIAAAIERLDTARRVLGDMYGQGTYPQVPAEVIAAQESLDIVVMAAHDARRALGRIR